MLASRSTWGRLGLCARQQHPATTTSARFALAGVHRSLTPTRRAFSGGIEFDSFEDSEGEIKLTKPELAKFVELPVDKDDPYRQFDDILDPENPPNLSYEHYQMLKGIDFTGRELKLAHKKLNDQIALDNESLMKHYTHAKMADTVLKAPGIQGKVIDDSMTDEFLTFVGTEPTEQSADTGEFLKESAEEAEEKEVVAAADLPTDIDFTDPESLNGAVNKAMKEIFADPKNAERTSEFRENMAELRDEMGIKDEQEFREMSTGMLQMTRDKNMLKALGSSIQGLLDEVAPGSKDLKDIVPHLQMTLHADGEDSLTQEAYDSIIEKIEFLDICAQKKGATSLEELVSIQQEENREESLGPKRGNHTKFRKQGVMYPEMRPDFRQDMKIPKKDRMEMELRPNSKEFALEQEKRLIKAAIVRNQYYEKPQKGLPGSCIFCKPDPSPNGIKTIDYKNVELLYRFINKRGMITGKRENHNCAKHQRKLAKAIKRSRQIGLLNFTNDWRVPYDLSAAHHNPAVKFYKREDYSQPDEIWDLKRASVKDVDPLDDTESDDDEWGREAGPPRDEFDYSDEEEESEGDGDLMTTMRKLVADPDKAEENMDPLDKWDSYGMKDGDPTEAQLREIPHDLLK